MSDALRRIRGRMTDGAPRGWARRTLVSWLGLALLLFNLTAGLSTPGAAGTGAADGRMVVCTAAGMAVINPDGTPAGPGHDEFCVFCLPLLHAGGAAPVAVIALPAPVGHGAATLPPEPIRLAPPQRLLGGATPRAPPRA